MYIYGRLRTLKHDLSGRTRNKPVAHGFALIEILVVLVIVAILSAGLYSFYAGKRGSKPSEQKSPMIVARDSECLQNLRSVRQVIEATKTGDPDAKPPSALTDMRELTSELRECPVGHEPYAYDPGTGQVHCVHPGHENY